MRATSDRINIAQPDVILFLNINGVIERASLAGVIAEERSEEWLGRPWVETVTDLGGDKVRRMIDDARQKGVSAFCQMTQRFPSGLELPMEYTAVRLGARGGLIAVGKNLIAVAELQSRLVAAQQVMERDYWKLREVKTRYRRLFDASNDAVLLLKPTNLRIVEANAAAIKTLKISSIARDERSGERDFLGRLPADERASFEAMLERVRDQGRSPGMVAHVGRERKTVMMRASLMTSEAGEVFLLQLTPIGAMLQNASTQDHSPVEGVIDRFPDAFAMIDREGFVVRANSAFTDLVEATT
ncbi:MAG: PAS domain-containing protein, partial [Methylobacteriaceae bacterium]|nr:PAS domain-containing protein [Methylobacteriaceae bacterium]